MDQYFGDDGSLIGRQSDELVGLFEFEMRGIARCPDCQTDLGQVVAVAAVEKQGSHTSDGFVEQKRQLYRQGQLVVECTLQWDCTKDRVRCKLSLRLSEVSFSQAIPPCVFVDHMSDTVPFSRVYLPPSYAVA